ncbi:hypothetical protein SCLCIDRAFT_33835 [Scleroderma citrinum Foug A]|uniref:Uncharacterized protein n=1 Tax=Scleroderma citrinum Foug A TaxID=1036808 RepID=A0A0C2ZDB6_9AGAM|nr:hypothetical protein SCLCIDRAFT_33835 [Scleroderma citrinum Foug A]
MGRLDEDNYAYRTIYLNVVLNDVENTFWCILELMKVPLLAELDTQGVDKVLFDPMGNWPLAAHVLDPEKCLCALLEGAWATSYGQYHDWRQQLDKPHNVRCGTQAFQNHT